MSHYSVAVFCNEPYQYYFDKLMEPFNETDERYFKFVLVPYDNIVSDFIKFQKQNPKWTLDQYIKDLNYVQKNNIWGYKCNPNGYYDYYTIDGKSYLFDIKPRRRKKHDFYKKSQIDWFKINQEELDKASYFWDDFVINRNDQIKSFYKPEYYLKRYKTKEQYLKEIKYTIPYAFVTPDGEWHSSGKVGWFGLSNETAESYNKYYDEWFKFINNKKSNPFVSILDCHI